jgi:hypothetical protein
MKIIAGPCQLEESSIITAQYCKRIAEDHGFEYFSKQVLIKLIELL